MFNPSHPTLQIPPLPWGSGAPSQVPLARLVCVSHRCMGTGRWLLNHACPSDHTQPGASPAKWTTSLPSLRC